MAIKINQLKPEPIKVVYRGEGRGEGSNLSDNNSITITVTYGIRYGDNKRTRIPDIKTQITVVRFEDEKDDSKEFNQSDEIDEMDVPFEEEADDIKEINEYCDKLISELNDDFDVDSPEWDEDNEE